MKRIFLLILFILFLTVTVRVWANELDDCRDANCFSNLIDKYAQKINDAQAQKKTLANEISIADGKIALTNVKIAAGENRINYLGGQIASVSGKIDSIEKSLDATSQILLHRIEQTYIVGRSDPVIFLLGSNDFLDLISRFEFLRITQKHDKKLMEQMAVSKKNYNDQKDVLGQKKLQVEIEKAQLEQDKKTLVQLKASKRALLDVTQNDEARYQQLLSQARAQLAAFGSFVQAQGGASLLSNQTQCDDWGCYYNQRDRNWGAAALNGTRYTLADSGCLVTSMAMVLTHSGHKGVTPLTINANSANFALYFPAYLNKSINADGVTATRVGISYSDIDGELSAGRPVIIGIGNGPAHFVVFVSGSKGNYQMNDPYVENGKKIDFTSKYSLGSISEIEKVVF